MTVMEASARLGRVRFDDLAASVGEARVILVRALTASGAPIDLTLGVTTVWGGASGWHRTFACPSCGQPARILGLNGTKAECRRCTPIRSRHQLQKTTAAWTREGFNLVDRLQRHLEQGHCGLSDIVMATARALRRRSLQRLQHALELLWQAVSAAESETDEPPCSDSVEEAEVEKEIELPPHFRPFECWKRSSPAG
jgi:hypothetical protein